VRRRERQVDVAGLPDRLATVEGLENGELPRALLQDAGDPVQVLRPFGRGDVRPAVVERLAGGGDRKGDVLRVRVGNVRKRLLRGRADARLELPRARLDELAADEEPVALLELDHVPRLRSRRVLEGGGDQRAILLQRGGTHGSPASPLLFLSSVWVVLSQA
jgi:hypothetical protein